MSNVVCTLECPAAKARIADSKAALVKAPADHAALAAQAGAVTQDARDRIDQMMKRLEVGQAQIRAQAVAQLARRDQQEAMWRDRAGATNDKALRAYYLAKAAGEDLDD